MRKLVFSMILLMGYLLSQGQQNNGINYTTAIGVKVYPGAISVKHFISQNAIEALGYVSSDGFRITGLYELHNRLGTLEGLKWYVGGGGHIGIWSDTWKNNYPTREGGLAIGVDGVLGLDYKIKNAPLNISFDWQPSFNVLGYSYFEGGWGGLGIRYTLR